MEYQRREVFLRHFYIDFPVPAPEKKRYSNIQVFSIHRFRKSSLISFRQLQVFTGLGIP